MCRNALKLLLGVRISIVDMRIIRDAIDTYKTQKPELSGILLLT